MSIELIFGVIAGAKKLYEAFAGKPVPPQVDQVIAAGRGLHDAIKDGLVSVPNEAGVPLTPAEFDAKFAAWELAQEQARTGAAERIENRPRGDATGEP